MSQKCSTGQSFIFPTSYKIHTLEPKPKDVDVDETHPAAQSLAYRVRGDSIWGTGILQNAPEQHCSSSIASEVVEF